MIIEEALHLFEHRLNEVGDLLMDSFQEVLNESKSDIARSCLIHAIKPERDHNRTNLLKFLMDRIDQPKMALKSAITLFKAKFKMGNEVVRAKNRIKLLTVHSSLYCW